MRDRSIFIVNDVIYRIHLDGSKAVITVSFPPWANVVPECSEQRIEMKGIEVKKGRIVNPPDWLPEQVIEAFQEVHHA